MSDIQWTGITLNPTTGCSYASEECFKCYSEEESERKKHNPKQPKYREGFHKVVEHPKTLLIPFTWKDPQLVFVNSMSDTFHKDVSIEFIQRIFEVMNMTPEHTYQLLTKRHHRLTELSNSLPWGDNIWMGVSVGIQKMVRRIDHLRMCGAKHKFISFEPLIEEISNVDLTGIDWAIVGGESGDNDVRPMKKEWVLKLKEMCEEQNVPFFFKQWGKDRNNPDPNDPTMNPEHRYYAKGGCLIDGKLYRRNPCRTDDTIPALKLFGEEHLIMDEYLGLNTIWELKSFLPMMAKDSFEALRDDIKRNGVNSPMLYYTTKDGIKLVIDGHSRLKAAISLKLKEIPTREVSEQFNSLDEIKLWMVEQQCQRRNLSPVERLRLASISRPTIEKMANENIVNAGKKNKVIHHIDTDAKIARLAGVSKSTVTRYNSVITNASQQIVDKMHKGELSVGAAYMKIDNAPKPQRIIRKVKQLDAQPFHFANTIEEGRASVMAGETEALVIIRSTSQIGIVDKKYRSKVQYCVIEEQDESLYSNE